MPSEGAKDHESAARRMLPRAWAHDGEYDIVERSRLPVLGAMRRALQPLYEWKIPKEGQVLVMGAGRGFERRLLPASIPDSRIVWTDIHRDALRHYNNRDAEGRERARRVVGSSYSLPFRDGSFSSVVSLDHMDVFPPHLLPQVVGEARRVLAPGGAMIAAQSSVPTLHWSENERLMNRAMETGGRLGPFERQLFVRELQETHRRYREALIRAMGRSGFGNVRYRPTVASYFGPRETRHREADYPGQHESGIPTYVFDMGTKTLADWRSVGHEQILKAFPRARIVLPTPERLRGIEDPVGEMYSNYAITGEVAGPKKRPKTSRKKKKGRKKKRKK